MHILDTDEIGEAAKLVNSNGGLWGYVTIPIRSNDIKPDKWKTFFKKCAELKIIPIIRLATYPEKENWVKPTVYDLVDFANFLNEMPWPTKNRYVVLFNEVNRANEWGGEVSPGEYAALLIDAKRIFNTRSTDYFLLSAGLDMSAPNSKSSMDAFAFYRQMNVQQPRWLDYIDGLSAHAYPNPGFSASPYTNNRYGILSFQYELNFLKTNKPVFITETGTLKYSGFWPAAFAQWSQPNIVAITPFLLYAGSGDFAKFSLKLANGNPNDNYREIEAFPKVAGSPLLSTLQSSSKQETFKSQNVVYEQPSLWIRIKNWLNNLGYQKLIVGDWEIKVEVMNDEKSRAQGLSGRDKLDSNVGMLFVFDRPGKYGFWMKDMKFDLDFIWIRDNKIVQIDTNISNPKTLIPNVDVDKVLEIAAGEVTNHNIKIGDLIK